MSSWDKIAKTGTYTDMHGNTYTFTSKDFAEIVSNYQSQIEKAPLVIGHPKTDSPAFGWISKLRINGEYLEAQYEQVSEQIKEAVHNGSYKYKSISLYPNLKQIKHVGLLGATPPAINGLGEVNFSRHNNEAILYFSENTGEQKMDEKVLLEKISELEKELMEKKSEIEELKNELIQASQKEKDAEAKIEEVTSNFACHIREEKVNSLIKAGKLEPSKKDEVMKTIEKLSSGTPSFASGEKNELVEAYLKTISKDTELLGEFSAHSEEKGSVGLNDIISKL